MWENSQKKQKKGEKKVKEVSRRTWVKEVKKARTESETRNWELKVRQKWRSTNVSNIDWREHDLFGSCKSNLFGPLLQIWAYNAKKSRKEEEKWEQSEKQS